MTMSTVLVAYATKMGSTKEIAEAVAAEIAAAGDGVSVLPAQHVHDLDHFDAVVLGSAIYATRWRPEAVRFLQRHEMALISRPVWLFHSGPTGAAAHRPQVPPAAVRRLARTIRAHGPVTFGGRIDTATAQGFVARRLANGAFAGDFRDWDQIRRWAAGITHALRVTRKETSVPWTD
jgi:menaquinone-dependent protoporphyrinogen oxidase